MKIDIVEVYTNRVVDVAHKLDNYEGKCRFLHGHSMKFEVWVKGYVNSETGMVIDFVEIKNIIDELDHHYLNEILDFLPTAENLSIYIAEKISNINPNLLEIRVRCWETSNSYAEYEIKRDINKQEVLI